MASVQERNGAYRVIFRFRGKQHFVTIGKVAREEATAKAAQIDYLLMRIKQGFIEFPAGGDIGEFVLHDGKPPSPSGEPVANGVAKATLGGLRDRYLATHEGAHESSTLYTSRIHFRHLARILGEGFPLRDLQRDDIQKYIEDRARSAVSPITARKEVATFRAAWNWGVGAGLCSGVFPSKGLVYPKTDEKPPFQTFEQIERQIARGGLSDRQRAELWECLFLTQPEIEEFLALVKVRAGHPWIYPMICFAAHTGARRSEMLRARVTDIDFEGEIVRIREKKKEKGRRTIRNAPLSPFLSRVLREWLAMHPGGLPLFCHADEVGRSRTRGRAAREREVSPEGSQPLTRDEAHDHFGRTLAGTKWGVVQGWHVLRHSFISCCVASGVDQRIIDDWVGHTTEEMRKRYRHLAPSAQKIAIRSVFS